MSRLFRDDYSGKQRLLGVAPVSGGRAAFKAVLRVGPHALHAVYLGDGGHLGSTSATVPLRVRPGHSHAAAR